MKEPFWKRIRTKVLFEHPRLTVVEDEVELPTGTITQYMRYEGLADYVTIIARQGDMIALRKEYSYPHDEWLWQFPEGSIEKGDTPDQAAMHEFAEEAQLQAKSLELIGMNYSHHRRSTEKNYIYVATELTDSKPRLGDEEEYGAEIHWFTHQQIKEMIKDGSIKQKNALAALALYFCLQS